MSATPDRATRRNNPLVTAALVGATVVLAAFPMLLNFGDPEAEEPFGGTDGAAEDVVAEVHPGYEPWFESITGELPGEVESGLFALQAGIGGGVLGYALGWYRGGAGRRGR
ncbi:cobalt transport protein CbiN [Corynebacterium sphenisci DSM 44792]|uniref:Cobalt transport protein CbiN n=1 Tax=Corynebacterium sphenisci DSM 44792 TaxID=1437874 RepID=A0A1L7CZM1_9CORY|nr:energy-coupling factor ABC transporter substrate-binding protein [Corynebacterium sphenisci]APT91272.1 cobalt transport protein CbiN [Corynebacterium sphenisci DSM 44792]